MKKNKLSQSQIDIVLAEAYTECYMIKETIGEENFIKIMEICGGGIIEIPTVEEFKELCKVYYGQDNFKTSHIKGTNRDIIKQIQKDSSLKTPSQLKESLTILSHKTKLDMKPLYDVIIERKI